MIEDAREGIKSKANTKFIERSAKAPEHRRGLGKLKP
jgi:hypothetical protein